MISTSQRRKYLVTTTVSFKMTSCSKTYLKHIADVGTSQSKGFRIKVSGRRSLASEIFLAYLVAPLMQAAAKFLKPYTTSEPCLRQEMRSVKFYIMSPVNKPLTISCVLIIVYQKSDIALGLKARVLSLG